MTQEEQAYRFGMELRQLVDHYTQEYPDMMTNVMIGILKVQTDRLSLLMNQVEFKKSNDPEQGTPAT